MAGPRMPPAKTLVHRGVVVACTLPALYLADAVTILFVLFVYRTATPWPDAGPSQHCWPALAA